MNRTKTRRCEWALNDPLLTRYHDREWGTPLHDDMKLFEFLTLEGTQAGLSWLTVLRKRQNYRKTFDHFNPAKVARYTSKKVDQLLTNPGIIRNRLKILATVNNANRFISIQEEFGSFNNYIWEFTGKRPIQRKFRSIAEIPAETRISAKMSHDMEQRGFKFVGSTICYAFMQATGMTNDHLVSCFRHRELGKTAGGSST